MTPRDDGLVRGRDGDLVPADLEQRHHCDGGWVGEQNDHPIPCLICRPHLLREIRRAAPEPHRTRPEAARAVRTALAAARLEHREHELSTNPPITRTQSTTEEPQ